MENKITADPREDFGCLPQFQPKIGRICSEAFEITFQKRLEALISLHYST